MSLQVFQLFSWSGFPCLPHLCFFSHQSGVGNEEWICMLPLARVFLVHISCLWLELMTSGTRMGCNPQQTERRETRGLIYQALQEEAIPWPLAACNTQVALTDRCSPAKSKTVRVPTALREAAWGAEMLSELLETTRGLLTKLEKGTVLQDTLLQLLGKPSVRVKPSSIKKKTTQQLKSHSSQYKKINYGTTWNVAHVHTWKYENGASKDMLGRKGGAWEAERCPEKKPTAVFVSMPLPIAFHKQCLGEKASINVNNCSLLQDPWPICKLTQFLNYIHL